MATNAFGKDFYIGQIWRSKDSRESMRHVVIADMHGRYAVCRTYFPHSKTATLNRTSKISFKTLATRWETCTETKPCAACSGELL